MVKILDADLTFQGFVMLVHENRFANPAWRYGQTVMNVLAVARPDLADEIWGGELDPFYDDTRLSACLTALAESW